MSLPIYEVEEITSDVEEINAESLRNIDLLIEYLGAHGHDAHELEGRLFATSVYSQRNPRGVIESYSELEEIEPTVHAVREWLGY